MKNSLSFFMTFAKRFFDKYRIRLFWILFCLLMINSRAFAADSKSNETNDFFDLSIEELLEIPVVVSASRNEQKITEVSVPVSIITQEDIHYGGLTNIPEILQFAPGIDMLRADRNHYALGVRGLHEIWSDRTLVLINGRNLDSPLFGGTDWQYVPLFVEDIKHIEIVRGPGGAAWGANAFNGVINIITKEPNDVPEYFASSTINHFGDSYSHLRWSQKDGKFSWRTSLGYENQTSSHDAISSDYVLRRTDMAGFFDSSSIESRDFSRSWKTDNEFIYKITDQTKWSLGAAFGHFEQGDYEMLGYVPNKDMMHDTGRFFVKVDHDFENEAHGYLQFYNNFNNSDRPPLLKYNDMESDIEGQYDFLVGDNHKVTIGGNVRLIRIDSEIKDANDFIIVDEPLDEDWMGIFVMDHWKLTDRFAIESQYRRDKYSETHSDWSARLSMLYAFDDEHKHMLRLSGARAYRAPLASLRKFQTQRLLVSPGLYAITLNPGDIHNEEIWSLEAGYTGQITKKFSFRTDAYYQRYGELIGYKDTPNPWDVIITSPQNIDGATSYGGETELVWKEKWGRFSAWYAYNNFIQEQSYQEIRAYHPAKDKVGLTARISLPDNVTLNGNYKYTARTSFSDDETVHPTRVGNSHRFDISVTKEFLGQRGEITFGVNDIFNDTKQKVQALGRLGSYETPGRMIFLRMQYKF